MSASYRKDVRNYRLYVCTYIGNNNEMFYLLIAVLLLEEKLILKKKDLQLSHFE